MKRLFALILCLTIILSVGGAGFAYADDTETTVRPVYALITSENCMLYRSDSGETVSENIYFRLPDTYFVQILDAGENFHRVKYLEFAGYVSVNDVEISEQLPVTVYPSDVTFEIDNDGFGVHIRKQAKRTSDIEATIPSDAGEIKYFGINEGEEVYSGEGAEWYFVEYEGVCGYVYNVYVVPKKAIPANVIEWIPEAPAVIDNNDPISDVPKMDTITKTVIIIALIIPALLIVYMLFRRRPERATSASESSASPRRSRKPKYYRD